MTAKQASVFLKISRQTVTKYCRLGIIKNATLRHTENGAVWFIPKREAERFARNGDRPKLGRPKELKD